MNLAINTDFTKSTGSPEPYLRAIAEAGFTHIMWCHQWNTDFLYSRPEIAQIRRWLDRYGLRLLDLHASAGVEKNWTSLVEYERLAGVELVRNRLDTTAELGGDAIMMHTGAPELGQAEAFWRQLRASLDELEPSARKCGLRIAIENGDWEIIETILADYPPDYVGICYDSGHGNFGHGSLDQLAAAQDRLICVHLNDNDGSGDQHKLLFAGTVNWSKLAQTIANSSYTKCISMEVARRCMDITDEADFLRRAHETGVRFAQMAAASR